MRAEGKLEDGLPDPSQQGTRAPSLRVSERKSNVAEVLRSQSKLAEDSLLSIAEEPLFSPFQKEPIDSLAIQGWREDFNCLYLSAHSPLKQDNQRLQSENKKDFISAELEKGQRRKLPKCRAGKRQKPAAQTSTQASALINQVSFQAPSPTKSLDLGRKVIGKVDFVQGTPLVVFQRKRSALKPIYVMFSRPSTNLYAINKTETRARSKSTNQPKPQRFRESNQIKTITYPTELICAFAKEGSSAKCKFSLKKQRLPSR